MCATTNDEEEKNSVGNTPLHLSPSVSPTNGDSGKTNPEPSRFSSISGIEEKKDDGDSDIDPVIVSLSLSQAGAKRAEGKNILSLLDEGDENQFDPRNSSFLANSERAPSENGSISETKETVDSDSQVASKNFCAGLMSPAGVCEGSSEFAEQMDIFMRCQHPLDLLAMFHEDETRGRPSINHSISGDVEEQVHRVSGYHALSRKCEYCGSLDIDLCRDSPDCERPKTFFPRERPPFYSHGGLQWKEEKNFGTALKGGETNAIAESDKHATKNAAWV